MLNKFNIYYPEEIIEKLYDDFYHNNMGIYTFDEYCFVHYGQYVSEFHHKQRRYKTNLLFSHYI